MKERNPSLLGWALLGLIHQKACSGYDLRKMFTLTPMRSFSDSPGAIYPALRRLEEQGLVRHRVEESSGLRRRRVFRLTPAGVRAFQNWLRRPIGRDDAMARLDELLLRFSYMDQGIGRGGPVRFLKAMERELSSYIPTLHEYLEAHQANMPRSGRLALECGIRGYESLRKWVKYALGDYGEK